MLAINPGFFGQFNWSGWGLAGGEPGRAGWNQPNQPISGPSLSVDQLPVHTEGQQGRHNGTHDQKDEPDLPGLFNLPPHDDSGQPPETHRCKHHVDRNCPELA